MDALSSRILLRPGDLDRSRRFYRDLLGLAVYREFGPPDDPGLVFFLGQGLLEVSGHAAGPPGNSVMISEVYFTVTRPSASSHRRMFSTMTARFLGRPPRARRAAVPS